MKLFHRGVSYETTPSNIEFQVIESVGKYRGASMRFTAPVGLPHAQSVQLSYRGVSYPSVR